MPCSAACCRANSKCSETGQQRLRRNAADVDARAAERLVHLDADGVEAELRGANRGDVAAGTAADDDDVGRCCAAEAEEVILEECRYSIAEAAPLVDRHRAGIFHQLLHAHEEQHGLLAVDDAVVVRQRDVHHRPDLDLAVHRDRAILGLVQAEDADLRDS